MKPFVVGIPTYNRYDCLVRCIAHLFCGSATPDRVYVIDNGGGLLESRHWELGIETFRHRLRIEVVTPQKNLGVAASWNILHRLTRPTRLMLVNDDVFVGMNTMEVLSIDTDSPCIATALGWSCFRHDHEAWDIIGDYDEFFYPAYYEDNDMDWRRELAGVRRVICENVTDKIEHSPSSTMAAMTNEEKDALRQRHAISTAYYRAKWGGLPKNANDPNSGERFKKPFDGASQEQVAEIIRNMHSPERFGFPRTLVSGQKG